VPQHYANTPSNDVTLNDAPINAAPPYAGGSAMLTRRVRRKPTVSSQLRAAETSTGGGCAPTAPGGGRSAYGALPSAEDHSSHPVKCSPEEYGSTPGGRRHRVCLRKLAST
jgi:hypothetical protein